MSFLISLILEVLLLHTSVQMWKEARRYHGSYLSSNY